AAGCARERVTARQLCCCFAAVCRIICGIRASYQCDRGSCDGTDDGSGALKVANHGETFPVNVRGISLIVRAHLRPLTASPLRRFLGNLSKVLSSRISGCCAHELLTYLPRVNRNSAFWLTNGELRQFLP